MKRRDLSTIALFLGVALVGCTPEGRSTPPIAVMTFNIRYGTADDGANSWPNRATMVIDVIRDRAPDILGLQEALRFQLDELGAALPEYREIGVGRDDGKTAGEYAAILVRRDRFQVEASGTFWLSDTPEVPGSMSWGNRIPRICTWVRLADAGTADRLEVYNVHLDHESQESRERSAELIARHLAARQTPEPVIVLGDFNAGEDNPVLRYLTGALDHIDDGTVASPRLMDTLRPFRRDTAEFGTFNAFRGETGGAQIDWILVSDEWDVLEAAIVRTNIGGRYPSDHFPVTALLRYGE
jgi:endonuclease/exonuclease/phosphatase family metal-dependent hydrolase